MNKSAFAYRNGVLCAETLPLAEIAEDVETPFYCTSAAQITTNWKVFAAPLAGGTLFYKMRANPTLAVLRTLANQGAGMRVTSAGEIERAIEAGLSPARIVMSGTGKDRDDLAAALLAGIAQIHVESQEEIEQVRAVAAALGRKASVALRLNLGFSSASCGPAPRSLGEDRYGLSLALLPQALAQIWAYSDTLDFEGLAVSLPAEAMDSVPARLTRLAEIVRLCRAQGFRISALDLDIDGCPDTIGGLIETSLGRLGCALSFVAGRQIVSDATVLVTRVLSVKESEGRKMCVVDADIAHLVRPALSGARREVLAAREESSSARFSRYALVGPVCDSSEQFGDCCLLPSMQTGDVLAVMNAGVKGGFVLDLSSGRTTLPDLYVSGANYAVVRRRIAVSELMEWESLPDWMSACDAA